MTLDTTSLFDTQRYPIHDPAGSAYQELVAEIRKAIDQTSFAKLPGFVRPRSLEAMQRQAENLVPQAVFHRANLNPYFVDPPDGMPSDHPLNRFAPRTHGMVRGDLFTEDGAIRSAFLDDALCRFVADCLGVDSLYPYRDPFGCVNVNVQPEGSEFSWHFDTNDFTVSIGLSQPSEGGVFEYAANIRDETDENYGAVQSVLDGDRTRVETLVLNPGDIQIFRGKHTLHRVTAPVGATRRSLLLSYVCDPDHMPTPEESQKMWGEVHPLHEEHARRLGA